MAVMSGGLKQWAETHCLGGEGDGAHDDGWGAVLELSGV